MDIKKGYEGGNFFTFGSKHGWKKAISKLKYNFVMLENAEQLLKISLIGYLFTNLGTIIALIFFILVKLWYLMVLMCGVLLIQYSGLKSTWQQYQQLKDIQEQFKEEENGI